VSFRAVAPPLAAWLAALASLWAVAALTSAPPFDAATWAHWDSGHYLAIAEHGYDVHHCRPGEVSNGATWCGDAAWFPGYPWAIALVHATGIPAVAAGVGVSWTFAAVMLVVLWLAFLRELPPAAGALGLVYAAFAPGYVYNFAVYPLSMFVAGVVGCLALLRAERWWTAGTVAFAASLVYPIGVMALPVLGLVHAVRTTRRVVPALAVAVPPLLAFGVVLLVQGLQTGRWTAFFDVQAHYRHGLHDPFTRTWTYLSAVAFTPGRAPYWQTVLLTVAVLLALVVAVLRRAWLLGVFALVFWVLPLTQANVSIWRSQDVLLPIAPLVARLPRLAAAGLAAAAVVVGVGVSRLYFGGALV
jgi:hypothetical protein